MSDIFISDNIFKRANAGRQKIFTYKPNILLNNIQTGGFVNLKCGLGSFTVEVIENKRKKSVSAIIEEFGTELFGLDKSDIRALAGETRMEETDNVSQMLEAYLTKILTGTGPVGVLTFEISNP